MKFVDSLKGQWGVVGSFDLPFRSNCLFYGKISIKVKVFARALLWD